MSAEKKWLLKLSGDSYFSRLVVHTDDGGYIEHEVRFTIKDDGALIMGGESEDLVYLYPEQIDHLRTIMAEYDKRFGRVTTTH